MPNYELNHSAEDTLLAALDGYFDHDLSHSIEEAEKAQRSGRLLDGASEWTQEDLDQLKRQEAHVKVLYEAIRKGQVSVSGEGVELPAVLRSDPMATMEKPETVPAATVTEGEVVYDELVTDQQGTEHALVIEKVAGEYQSFSQQRELNGDWGGTGEVAQFPSFEEADAHRAEIKAELTASAITPANAPEGAVKIADRVAKWGAATSRRDLGGGHSALAVQNPNTGDQVLVSDENGTVANLHDHAYFYSENDGHLEEIDQAHGQHAPGLAKKALIHANMSAPNSQGPLSTEEQVALSQAQPQGIQGAGPGLG